MPAFIQMKLKYSCPVLLDAAGFSCHGPKQFQFNWIKERNFQYQYLTTIEDFMPAKKIHLTPNARQLRKS